MIPEPGATQPEPRDTGAFAARRFSRWRIALSAILLACGGLAFVADASLDGGYLFRGDGTAYFLMARSLALDRDTDLTNEYSELRPRLPADSPVLLAVDESARLVPGSDRLLFFPWPIGTGLVMSPFYALGYGAELAVARLSDRSPDPFGALPQAGFGLGCLAYALLGFWSTVAICRRAFWRSAGSGAVDAGVATRAALWSTAALILGGPLLYYVFFHPTMSHAPSFGLASLLVLLWWRRWDGEVTSAPWEIGLVFGLLVLVRYQNAVFGLLPLSIPFREAWRRTSLPPSRAPRGRGALGRTAVLALAALAPLALELPELLRTGQLGRGAPSMPGLALAGNRFDLLSPHFLQVLFSCQHGAFYWSPVLALGFMGLSWVAIRGSWARLFLAVFVADVYLVGCLSGGTNWSGDHAFGMRYLAECAPLLAPGLAAMLANIAAFRPGRLLAPTVLSLLVAANGLLALAFGLRTIPHGACVTYPQMARGVAEAVARLSGRGR